MTTSAERLQELESQLSGLLNLKPKSQKERQKLERETETLTRTVASLKVYLALSIHEKVTDGQRFGVIISKTLSLDGMPQAWVSWSGAVEVPEPPERLTVIKPPSYAIGEKPQIPQDAPTMASLFTGGGLFEAGAMAAGFRPIWGIEFDPDNPDFSRQIADSYEQNFGSHIIRKSVQEVAQGGFQHLERPTVLHISQPCKSFSSANSKTESETDLSAARATQQAIQELQPSVVTVENVVSYRDSQSWQLIRETLTNLGYSIQEAVVNAADYGVPQKRQRFLAYAVQGQKPPEFPLSNPPFKGGQGGMGWLEAIADLIPTLPESQLADWQQQRMPSTEAGKAYLIERTGARNDRDLLVHPGNEPSWTIKANIATDHKGANRHDPLNALLPDGKVVSLDARAIARLQSVPDWYELPEPIGVAVTLIGNGVPCLLAQKLMEALKPLISEQPSGTGQDSFSTVKIPLADIRRDGGTQPRVAINTNVVQEYASDLKEGASFPPVLLFFDGHDYWMSDGFHRLEAALSLGWTEIGAEIREGTRRDAILYSVSANATHGLRRTNADKRQAVLTLLHDEEWSKWTNVAIAKACGVAESFVRKLKKESHFAQCDVRTYTTKHGTVATMKTANIGKGQSFQGEETGEISSRKMTDSPKFLEDKLGEISSRKNAAPPKFLEDKSGSENISSRKMTDPPKFLEDKSDPKISSRKTRRDKGNGSGCIYCRTVTKNGKQYQEAYYQYEFWSEGDRVVKSSKYIPKGKLATVQQLDEQKAPVREILKVLGVG